MKFLFDEKFLKRFEVFLKYALVALVVLQGLAIFLINLLQTDRYLFYDNTLAIRHAVEMWRNGIFLEGYNYYSTMEIDNAAFFAAPIYMLTGNLGLSLGLIHVLLYALSVKLLCSLFQNGGYDVRYGLIASLMIFSPYVIEGLEWGNMMFVTVGQYEFRVIVMLSMANLLLYAQREQPEQKKYLGWLIFHLVFCFWTTLSCGNYVLLMIILPYVLFFVYMNCVSERFHINKHALFVVLTSVAVCVITLVFRDNAIGETSRSTLPLLTADSFIANMENCITGFFMLFGALNQEPFIPIFSLKGILKISKFVLISACLVLMFMKMKKLKHSEQLPYMFIFIAVVNLAVMLTAFTRYGAMIYEHRYHIIWGAMLLVVAVAAIDGIEHVRLKNLVIVVMLFLMLLINYGGFNHIFEDGSVVENEKQVISLADERKINTIYVYDMMVQAAAIRTLDLDKSCMSVTLVDGVVHARTDNYYNDYSSQYTFDEKHIFVCRPENFEALPDQIKSCYLQVDSLEIGYVYIGYENPWLD